MANKLWSILGLCVVFSIVLMFIHSLAVQRDYYHSLSALLGSLDYQMIIRSMKYGMVLVIMVFSAFFLERGVAGLARIHPMQYHGWLGIVDVLFAAVVVCGAYRLCGGLCVGRAGVHRLAAVVFASLCWRIGS